MAKLASDLGKSDLRAHTPNRHLTSKYKSMPRDRKRVLRLQTQCPLKDCLGSMST